MGTAKLRIKSIAHRVCECGYPYTQDEFEALSHNVLVVDDSIYEVRSCVSCQSGLARLVRRRPVDDVD